MRTNARRVMAAEHRALERSESDVPELHRAGAVLQRDRAARVFRVFDVNHLLAVDEHGHFRTARGDVDRVPFAAGHDDRQRFGDIDDGARPIALVGPSVENVHLVGVHGRDRFRVLAANEHAAVGIVGDPEIGRDLKVGVRHRRHQEPGARRRLHGAVGDRPVGVANDVPAFQRRAVEDGLEVRLTGGDGRLKPGEPKKHQADGERKRACHVMCLSQ